MPRTLPKIKKKKKFPTFCTSMQSTTASLWWVIRIQHRRVLCASIMDPVPWLRALESADNIIKQSTACRNTPAGLLAIGHCNVTMLMGRDQIWAKGASLNLWRRQIEDERDRRSELQWPSRILPCSCWHRRRRCCLWSWGWKEKAALWFSRTCRWGEKQMYKFRGSTPLLLHHDFSFPKLNPRSPFIAYFDRLVQYWSFFWLIGIGFG